MYRNLKKVKTVIKGKRIWKRLAQKYEIKKNQYLIICRAKEIDLAVDFIELLPEFIKWKHAQGSLVVTDSEDIYEKYSCEPNLPCRCVLDKGAEDILAYYTFFQFRERILVISLMNPFGSYGLINYGKISIRDMLTQYIGKSV